MLPPGVPEVAGLAPALTFVAAALVIFLIDTVAPDDASPLLLVGVTVTGALIAAGFAGWFLSLGVGRGEPLTLFDGALVVDGMALFFQAVFAFVTVLVAIASYDYLEGRAYQSEYYALVLFAATGMALMASANSLATAFVALELSSLPSYALVGFLKRDKTGSVEGGLKYFLVGALSSAVFVFGVSLLYAATGSLRLPDVAAAILEPASRVGGVEGIVGLGAVMVAGGVAFKTASVPFHFWAPEAYEGAPAPVSAFISSASKAAGFALAFRVFAIGVPIDGAGIDWLVLFQVLAVLTMTLGNFAAATQETVKRMLAYSSVGHAGYALIGLAAWSGGAAESAAAGSVMGASMAHLLVYGFMNTGAFLFVALAEHWGVGRTFEDYAGLARRAPVASVAMTVFMFSLAGLPPFGGFFSKYVLFLGAIDAGYWWLAAVGAVNSALSLFYYSRVVRALWIESPDGSFELNTTPTGLYAAVVVAAVGTLLLLPAFGPVVETAQTAAAQLVP